MITTYSPIKGLPSTPTVSSEATSKSYVDSKQELLVSGTNIKTINNISLLGSGNITISGGSGGGGIQVYDDGNGNIEIVSGGGSGGSVSAVEFVNFTESNGTWSCDTSIDTILSYISNDKMVYGVGYLDSQGQYCIIPLTYSDSFSSYKVVYFAVTLDGYYCGFYGIKVYDSLNDSWGSDEWELNEDLKGHDIDHYGNSTVSTSVTVTYGPSTRGSRMVSTSADLGVSFVVNNYSDNYLWIKNTGSSEIDITINSITLEEETVSNVYMPSDGISVPAGNVCEIGIICNNDGAFISSRNDLTL